MKQQTPPLVILHGWGLSKQRFEPLVVALRQRNFQVTALDFPGFGETPPPQVSFRLDDYAEYLHEYLKQHHIHRPIIIGHSFGGRVSLRYLTKHPQAISQLILTGTPGFSPVKKGKFFVFVAVGKLGKLILQLPFLSDFHQIVRDKYYFIIGAREYTRASGTMKETFKHIVTDPLVEDMERVSIPCHLIWGQDDQIVPIGIAKKMQQIMKGSTLTIIDNADHGVPYKQPNQFADAVDALI